MSLADKLKSPPPRAPFSASRGSGFRRRRGSVARRGSIVANRKRADSASSPKAATVPLPGSGTGASRKRPNLSRPPSSRTHKRPRPPSPPTPPHLKNAHGGAGTREPEGEAFGSFISILVSYARLILIAVYSHLLLLDQKNQIYWRFLTVGLTLFLWGLEIVISKEEEVAVGGIGELGAAASRG